MPRIDDPGHVVEPEHERLETEPGVADRDRRAGPAHDRTIGRQHEQDHPAAVLRAQRRDIDRPGPELVAVDRELDLDDHRGRGCALAVAQHDHRVSAILRRDHLGQVDRALLDAIVVELDLRPDPEQLGRELAAPAEQVDQELVAERRHAAPRSNRRATCNSASSRRDPDVLSGYRTDEVSCPRPGSAMPIARTRSRAVRLARIAAARSWRRGCW